MPVAHGIPSPYSNYPSRWLCKHLNCCICGVGKPKNYCCYSNPGSASPKSGLSDQKSRQQLLSTRRRATHVTKLLPLYGKESRTNHLSKLLPRSSDLKPSYFFLCGEKMHHNIIHLAKEIFSTPHIINRFEKLHAGWLTFLPDIEIYELCCRSLWLSPILTQTESLAFSHILFGEYQNCTKYFLYPDIHFQNIILSQNYHIIYATKYCPNKATISPNLLFANNCNCCGRQKMFPSICFMKNLPFPAWKAFNSIYRLLRQCTLLEITRNRRVFIQKL